MSMVATARRTTPRRDPHETTGRRQRQDAARVTCTFARDLRSGLRPGVPAGVDAAADAAARCIRRKVHDRLPGRVSRRLVCPRQALSDHHDARLNCFGVNASQSLAAWSATAGSGPRIREAGFSGTAGTTWAAGRRRRPANQALARDRATRRRASQALRAAGSRLPPETAAGSVCTGRTTAARCRHHSATSLMNRAVRVGISSCLMGEPSGTTAATSATLF